MTQTKYTHPNPTAYKLTQWLILLATVVILLSVPLQILIAVIYPQAVLFYLMAVITLMLTAPLLLYLTVTPTVSLDDAGLTVHPFIGKSHYIDWDAIQAVQDYPLLPRQSHEVNKRLVVGRKRYKQAEGIMLITSQLPMVYRVGGLFAGERGRKIIALTNRTHDDYDHLVRQVKKHTGKAANKS